MTRTDQKLISEAYNSIGLGSPGAGKGFFPEDPLGQVFNDAYYDKIVKIAQANVGNTFPEFEAALSNELDLRYQNCKFSLREIIEKIYCRLNNKPPFNHGF